MEPFHFGRGWWRIGRLEPFHFGTPTPRIGRLEPFHFGTDWQNGLADGLAEYSPNSELASANKYVCFVLDPNFACKKTCFFVFLQWTVGTVARDVVG